MQIQPSTPIFAVIDVETTGLDPRLDRVVEVACIRTWSGGTIERFSTLINPKQQISAAATAIHGIRDRDVAGAPSIEDVSAELLRLSDGAIVVGHNVRFDLSFLPCLSERETLCTLQLARRVVEASDYRNEMLRRALGLDIQTEGARPHRAAYDATVTEAILHELLRRNGSSASLGSVRALVRAAGRPIRLERFCFGRYRDTAVTKVPTGYLRWIIDEGFHGWPDVRHTAMLEIHERTR